MNLGGKQPGDPDLPALLVSYVYYAKCGFPRWQSKIGYRDWVLDSGAFSAKMSGVEIKLQDYIDFCKRLLDTDKTLVEIYSLDVIGDWRATLANTKAMWKQGIEAIPCFHYPEPWDVLVGYAKDFPKIAVGGIATIRGKNRLRWLNQAFARVWPKKVHGFGVGQRNIILGVPLHSTDSSSWEQGVCSFGRWQSLGNKHMSVRGRDQSLRNEIRHYLDLEKLARHRWHKEMKELEDEDNAPAVRLVAGASPRSEYAFAKEEPDENSSN